VTQRCTCDDFCDSPCPEHATEAEKVAWNGGLGDLHQTGTFIDQMKRRNQKEAERLSEERAARRLGIPPSLLRPAVVMLPPPSEPLRMAPVLAPAVAALFVDPRGPYWGRPDVDPWDESRDARNYRGSLPVVAHPPCNLWCKLARPTYARWGGEHLIPGNDGGCFASALEDVRRCGGVLEHPADTLAWSTFGLTKPLFGVWLLTGDHQWVTEVWQSAYGHRARKRTWLYYVRRNNPAPMLALRVNGTHRCGRVRKPGQGPLTLANGDASRTPPAFAEALISLARNCGGVADKC
jgi:hypothetical protein